GVDEIDAKLGHAAQCAQGLVAILGLAPHTLADNAHGPEAQAVDGEIAADLEGSGLRGIRCRHLSSPSRHGRRYVASRRAATTTATVCRSSGDGREPSSD